MPRIQEVWEPHVREPLPSSGESRRPLLRVSPGLTTNPSQTGTYPRGPGAAWGHPLRIGGSVRVGPWKAGPVAQSLRRGTFPGDRRGVPGHCSAPSRDTSSARIPCVKVRYSLTSRAPTKLSDQSACKSRGARPQALSFAGRKRPACVSFTERRRPRSQRHCGCGDRLRKIGT